MTLFFESTEFHNFSTDGVVALRVLSADVLDFILCLWSNKSELMVLFMVLNFWIDAYFIFESST